MIWPSVATQRNNAKHEFERPLCACCSNDDSNVYWFASHCNSMRWRSMATMLSVRFQGQKLALQWWIRYCWMGNVTCITANANHPSNHHEVMNDDVSSMWSSKLMTSSLRVLGSVANVNGYTSLWKKWRDAGIGWTIHPTYPPTQEAKCARRNVTPVQNQSVIPLKSRKGSAIGYCPNST